MKRVSRFGSLLLALLLALSMAGSLCSAQPEFHNGAIFSRRIANTVGFCRNQGLVIYNGQQRRFHQLRLHNRRFYAD